MTPGTTTTPMRAAPLLSEKIGKGGSPLCLWTPWLFLALVAGLVALDRSRNGSVVEAPAASAAELPADVPGSDVAVDPVCGMSVRKETADKASAGGRAAYFCSRYCRDDFLKSGATRRSRAGHLMRGLPTGLYQGAVAILLVLTFGLFELTAGLRRRDTARPIFELTALPGVRAALKKPWLRFAFQGPLAAAFLLVVAAGLFGVQDPALNLAPLLTWTVWWAGLAFLVLFLGKAWCFACPWDALATWVERLQPWGARREGLGLGLDWPRGLRNIWFAVGLFLALTWLELGMGITLIPRATAWVALLMLGLALASALVFDRKSFCRYGCLVGRVSGLYALFSGVEVRAKDPEVCAACRTRDCYRGNDRGDGCPTFEFPRSMRLNTYCVMCTECFRTCPSDNMALNLRPWGSDLAGDTRPRWDEAALSLSLLSMTAFHGLTMTSSWPHWVAAVESSLGLPAWAAFTALMSAVLTAPVLAYAALAALSARWSRPHGAGRLFIEYAYAMLPIALFYHLAHNAEHLFVEGPRLAALVSDPFGWGWNLFGTAGRAAAPLVTLEGLWWLQVLFVLTGHVYGLWVSERITRRLVPEPRLAFRVQLPMLLAMVLFSAFSLWLLKQPMEMRSSAM